MKILAVGGDGYVGSVLVPRLEQKHQVGVYDILRGQDIRDIENFRQACSDIDSIIYLAGITNNDECEGDPERAKSINAQSLPVVVRVAENSGIKRFIYASSVAAYGSSEEELREDRVLDPTTLYGIGKAASELVLRLSDIPFIITRSASVCGWSPRMRHDLTVNKMVHDALTKGVITVNGGEQFRCHIHIEDLCDFYELLLEAPAEKVLGQAFNVVATNEKVKDTAELAAFLVGGTKIELASPTDDRSYRVSGRKAEEVLGFKPKRTIAEAVHNIVGHRRIHNDDRK